MPAGRQVGEEAAADLCRLGVGAPDEVHQGSPGLARPPGQVLPAAPPRRAARRKGAAGPARAGRAPRRGRGRVPGGAATARPNRRPRAEARPRSRSASPRWTGRPDSRSTSRARQRTRSSSWPSSRGRRATVRSPPLGTQPLQFTGEDRRVAVPEGAPGRRGPQTAVGPGVGRGVARPRKAEVAPRTPRALASLARRSSWSSITRRPSGVAASAGPGFE